jgi:Putative Flp pilus-assembly TadE/G-like
MGKLDQRVLNHRKEYQRGNTLLAVAASMTVILGLAALGIDLISFYAARSEAQRSADAAALAGATFWSRSGCTSSSSGCSGFQTGAMNEAVDVGNQNLIGGVGPNIQSGDFSWNYSPASNPRISVTVQRTAARGNALPTFFAKILGFSSVDVSATATAEAYNPGTTGPTVGNFCVKPWLIPDPRITNPNALGTPLTIDPTGGQGQFPLILPAGAVSAECPTCSASNNNRPYRQSIECCNTRRITCGSATLQVASDNVKQDTQDGAKCLTHQSNGQQPDSLSGTSPFTITGGSGNPNPALRGQTITASDSLVTVPIYNGSSSSSCSDNDEGGGGCLVTATITGFMQLFIRNVDDDVQGRVQTTIMNISSCGGSSDVITGGGLSPVAVRLVF